MNDLVKRAGELADSGQPDEAIEICNRVILDEPDNPGALYVIGCVLLQAGRHAQAIQIGRRIVSVCPKDPRGYGLQALCWGEINRYDESVRMAEKALACRRSDKTLADVAYAHTNAGNWDLADKYCAEALDEAKRNPTPSATEVINNCRVSLGYIRLAQGRWKEGFQAYRATMRTKWRKERVYTAPDGETKEWQGESDATVIVTGEQGLGDEIMAAGVVPDAIKACKRFILDCDHRLAELFARSFPGAVIVPGRRQDQLVLPTSVGLPTHHKTLFGLSELFRQRDEDFPRKPYLVANQSYVSMFRDYFGGQKVIGLAWSGGSLRTGREQRTAGLNAFLPLIRKGGAEFVSLQYQDDSAEVREFERQFGTKVRRLPWVTQGPDMDLLAGLLAACDEVVGVHTSALHLSSALGVPTTVLTHKGSGWRYAQDELLWYPPTTRVFRKRSGESWRDCVTRL